MESKTKPKQSKVKPGILPYDEHQTSSETIK